MGNIKNLSSCDILVNFEALVHSLCFFCPFTRYLQFCLHLIICQLCSPLVYHQVLLWTVALQRLQSYQYPFMIDNKRCHQYSSNTQAFRQLARSEDSKEKQWGGWVSDEVPSPLSPSLVFIFLHPFLIHAAPNYLNAWNRLVHITIKLSMESLT